MMQGTLVPIPVGKPLDVRPRPIFLSAKFCDGLFRFPANHRVNPRIIKGFFRQGADVGAHNAGDYIRGGPFD